MKTYKEFITEARELDESKSKLAKIAFKSIKKIGKKLFKKAPKRSIDPYFAQKAGERNNDSWFSWTVCKKYSEI